MLLNTIAKKYPDSYVILSSNERSSDDAVNDWKVLNATKNYSQAKNLADYFQWIYLEVVHNGTDGAYRCSERLL